MLRFYLGAAMYDDPSDQQFLSRSICRKLSLTLVHERDMATVRSMNALVDLAIMHATQTPFLISVLKIPRQRDTSIGRR